jgi:hypothetical protein
MAIVPDDKNWTWVLERPCPECDFSADTIDVANMPTLIVDVAGRWPALFDHRDVRRRPNDRTWSALEYGCHVRDVFRLSRTMPSAIGDTLRCSLLHEPEHVAGDATHLDLLRTFGDPVAPMMAIDVFEGLVA